MNTYQIQINHIIDRISDIKEKMSDICTEVDYEFLRPAFLKDKQKSFERAKMLHIHSKQAKECGADLQGAFNLADIVDISNYPRLDYGISSLTASVNEVSSGIVGSVYCVNDGTYDWNGDILELNITVKNGEDAITETVREQADNANSVYFEYSIDFSDLYSGINSEEEIKVIFSVSYYPYANVSYILAGSERIHSFYTDNSLNKNSRGFTFETDMDDAIITGYSGNSEKIETPHIVEGGAED